MTLHYCKRLSCIDSYLHVCTSSYAYLCSYSFVVYIHIYVGLGGAPYARASNTTSKWGCALCMISPIGSPTMGVRLLRDLPIVVVVAIIAMVLIVTNNFANYLAIDRFMAMDIP